MQQMREKVWQPEQLKRSYQDPYGKILQIKIRSISTINRLACGDVSIVDVSKR